MPSVHVHIHVVSELFFLPKFIGILTTESFEIGMFLQKYLVSIFRTTAHVQHLAGFLGFLSFENEQRAINEYAVFSQSIFIYTRETPQDL